MTAPSPDDKDRDSSPSDKNERARKLEALAGELELNAQERTARLMPWSEDLRQAALAYSTEYRAAKVIREYIGAVPESLALSGETPRTDALFPIGPIGVPEIRKNITELADEFRQLERELAAITLLRNASERTIARMQHERADSVLSASGALPK